MLFSANICFSQEFSSSGGGKIDLLVSGGYTAIKIQSNTYTGYEAGIKLLFPFMTSKDFYIGIGAKYDYATFDPHSTQSQVSYNHEYDSFLAGLDFGYKFTTSLLDILINPYAYYSFYDTWLQTTTTATFQQTYSPYIIHNLNYGIGLCLLFKIMFDSNTGLYLGPSAYYSNAYMVYQNATDSKGNKYAGGEGAYSLYTANFTVGMFF